MLGLKEVNKTQRVGARPKGAGCIERKSVKSTVATVIKEEEQETGRKQAQQKF